MGIRIKINDKVKVITGKDNGKDGKIVQVLPSDDMVVVEGVNKMYKHIRGQKSGEKGQRIEFSAPVRISNVRLICPKCSKLTRVGYTEEDGKKKRACKKCKATID